MNRPVSCLHFVLQSVSSLFHSSYFQKHNLHRHNFLHLSILHQRFHSIQNYLCLLRKIALKQAWSLDDLFHTFLPIISNNKLPSLNSCISYLKSGIVFFQVFTVIIGGSCVDKFFQQFDCCFHLCTNPYSVCILLQNASHSLPFTGVAQCKNGFFSNRLLAVSLRISRTVCIQVKHFIHHCCVFFVTGFCKYFFYSRCVIIFQPVAEIHHIIF